VVKGEGFEPMCAWLLERLAQRPSDSSATEPAAVQPMLRPGVSVVSTPVGTSGPVMPSARPGTPAPVMASASPGALASATPPAPSGATVPAAQSAPAGSTDRAAHASPTDLPVAGVPDPLAHWLQRLLAAQRTDDTSLALLRLHAPGLPELPARLRRGVRAADALYQETEDTAWLCLPASAALAVRLALRFALLAGGRAADGAGERARVGVTLYALDPRNALAELAAAAVQPVRVGAPGQIALDCHAAAWGPAWTCDLPWPAARLMVAAP
jgi:hypothetical protein